MKLLERYITRYKTKYKGKPEWIIVHYTGCIATPIQVCDSMCRNEKSKASTHYIIQDNDIVHCVDESKYYAWHCGTYKKETYCDARNNNSIGIDLCPLKKSTKTKSVNDDDWYFSELTIETAAALIRSLMDKYGIDINHVVRHYDVTHKLCPRPFTGDDLNSVWKQSGEQAWSAFKEKIENAVCTSFNNQLTCD